MMISWYISTVPIYNMLQILSVANIVATFLLIHVSYIYNRTEKGYPLQIEADKIEYEESPFDAEFVSALLQKIDYDTLKGAVQQISEKCKSELTDQIAVPELPEEIPVSTDASTADEGLLRKLHTVMFDIHVVEGNLICPDTGRRFNIKMGIPNMILHADEIWDCIARNV